MSFKETFEETSKTLFDLITEFTQMEWTKENKYVNYLYAIMLEGLLSGLRKSGLKNKLFASGESELLDDLEGYLTSSVMMNAERLGDDLMVNSFHRFVNEEVEEMEDKGEWLQSVYTQLEEELVGLSKIFPNPFPKNPATDSDRDMKE